MIVPVLFALAPVQGLEPIPLPDDVLSASISASLAPVVVTLEPEPSAEVAGAAALAPVGPDPTSGPDPSAGAELEPSAVVPPGAMPAPGAAAAPGAEPSPGDALALSAPPPPVAPRSLSNLIKLHPRLTGVDAYGTSASGARLAALRVGTGGPDRPVVLVLADPSAARGPAREAVLELAETLVERFESDDPDDPLTGVDWWLVPDAHPDRSSEGDARTPRVATGFVTGWDPWPASGQDPGPWPGFDPEVRDLSGALTRLDQACGLVVVGDTQQVFGGGRLGRHGRDGLGLPTLARSTTTLVELDPLCDFIAGLPRLAFGAPTVTALGEELWLVEVEVRAEGSAPGRPADLLLTWSGVAPRAFAFGPTADAPHRTAAVIAERVRVPGLASGESRHLRFILRGTSDVLPGLRAGGPRWWGTEVAVPLQP